MDNTIFASNPTSKEALIRKLFNRRDKLVNSIKIAFISKKKRNLPIYGVKCKDLREFTTTEKDLERGISRIPLQLSRLNEEDLLDDQAEALIPNVITEVDESGEEFKLSPFPQAAAVVNRGSK